MNENFLPAASETDENQELPEDEYQLCVMDIMAELQGQNGLYNYMSSIRPKLAEMEPEKRRAFCAMLKDEYPSFGNKTGVFFNRIAGANRKQPIKYEDLGPRIMAARNVNYIKKEKKAYD